MSRHASDEWDRMVWWRNRATELELELTAVKQTDVGQAYARVREMQEQVARTERARAEAPDLPSHYGATRIETVQRDFNALRAAIRAHDSFAAEAAWDRCERWLGLWPMEDRHDHP